MPRTSTVPDFAVRVNGTPLPPAAAGDVRSIQVDESIDVLSMFTIELYCWDPATLTVTWPDDRLFAVGNDVEISLGYVDDLEVVMTGEITGLEPSFTDGAPPALLVRGHDHRHRLARGTRTKAHARTKDSGIAALIARSGGLRAQVKDSKVTHDLVFQSNQSDLEFLRQRADRIGYEVFVRDKVLYFRPPPDTGPAVASLDVMDDLSSFTPRLSSLGQPTGVAARGWDVKKKEAFHREKPGNQDVKKAFGTSVTTAVEEPMVTAAELDPAVQGVLRRAAYVRGEAELAGRTDLRTGTTVEITGAGKTFSGLYYVTGVRHDFELGGSFRTSFDVRRSGVPS